MKLEREFLKYFVLPLSTIALLLIGMVIYEVYFNKKCIDSVGRHSDLIQQIKPGCELYRTYYQNRQCDQSEIIYVSTCGKATWYEQHGKSTIKREVE